MYLTLITVALLGLSYGMAWHNESARPTVIERRDDQKQRLSGDQPRRAK